MVSSRLAMLVDAAWPEISAALRQGLEEEGKGLSTLVTLVERPSDLSEHVSLGWSLPTAGETFEEQTLTATPGSVHQLRVTMPLDRSAIDPAPSRTTLDAITTWAQAARQAEHRWMLGLIAGAASSVGRLGNAAVRDLGPGWRIVVFEHVHGLEERCRARGVELVERNDTRVPGCKALAFMPATFGAARLEDLAPAFDYVDDGIRLMLSERVELLHFERTDQARRYASIGPISTP